MNKVLDKFPVLSIYFFHFILPMFQHNNWEGIKYIKQKGLYSNIELKEMIYKKPFNVRLIIRLLHSGSW